MKQLYIVIAFIFLGLAFLGAFLPVFPTTPFLLLASYFFAKGSKRFENWFKSLTLYKKHLETYDTQRAMTLQTKWGILIPVTVMLLLAFALTPVLVAKILILGVLIVKYLYFFLRIRTIEEAKSD